MEHENLNQSLYDSWSATYDTVENKTRDLEKRACREMLSNINFKSVLELGCGTGKNTVWLAKKAERVTAIDLSPQMQAIAKGKIKSGNVEFKLADISKSWNFYQGNADLITCSLILEHVEDLNFVFSEAYSHLQKGGHFYISELHPFKQYEGSKARFETEEGVKFLECFTHHISDYTEAARENKFSIVQLNEWFDENDKTNIPRLISFLFRK